jgi:hypothetical protein
MQFKHPELLYALFLLVIPIIVHLFQLRKFQKEDFTNVKFLQRVILQTRKSSQLKKWLILLTRLLLMACLIFAFAQPFFTANDNATKPQETVIYLDNSFSMQAKGQKGELLKRAIQELLETLPEDETFTLLTNTDRLKNTSLKESRNDIQQITYSAQDISINTALIRAKNEFSKTAGTVKNFVAISDFQIKDEPFVSASEDIAVNLVQLPPVNKNNISVDSVYVKERGINSITLAAKVSASESISGTLPVALYDGNTLLAKTSVELEENSASETIFNIQNPESINGNIRVEDTGLQYDNILYFSINKPDAIKVVAISDVDDSYLKKLFKTPEFELTSTTTAQLDYNQLNNANCVILNEITQLPNGLATILNKITAANGTVIIVPSENANLNSYNTLFSQLGLTSFLTLSAQEKQITSIVFAHPIYENVFDKRIENFQYPKVQSSYTGTFTGNKVLGYEDNTSFLEQTGGYYRFTAALNAKNSNFKNAPLIVPTFYNIAKQSLKGGILYYDINNTNSFDVKVALPQDNILEVVNENGSFIPLQQNYNSKVQITTTDLPKEANNFTVKNENEELLKVSFNYNRNESELTYQNISQLENVTINNQVSSFFQQMQQDNSITDLWKWFVIFALLFLCVEILLLKFVK